MIKISFVGDLMCEKEQLYANETNGDYDFNPIFSSIKSLFKTSDYVVGNLETPIAGEEMRYTNHKWSFNSPIEYAEAVKEAGFNLVSTANNHCLDRGVLGVVSTLNNLDKINIEHTGTFRSESERNTIFIKEIDGIKFAFLSYTYGTNASFNNYYLDKSNAFLVNLYRSQEVLKKRYSSRILKKLYRYKMKFDEKIPFNSFINPYLNQLDEDIKKAKDQADIVIMLMHSGGQYNIIPDKWTCRLQDYMIKKGVDVVVGCHPHVVQKGLLYNNRQFGFYSLGNFCSYPGSETSGNEGIESLSEYSIILHLFIDSTKKSVDKIVFQIAKSVVGKDGRANIYPLFDLIQRENSETKKRDLINHNKLIFDRFMGAYNKPIVPQEEYVFYSKE
ncbi:CapA family protein [Dysgonomonas massiliensis]|uniref:CapA family protein n=1 Tax=Dysgonomonas massiliensis TaxID=2040292 RepID=UPI000C755F2D|nr:CapA family protein [Dysgonomonas massiliensis]